MTFAWLEASSNGDVISDIYLGTSRLKIFQKEKGCLYDLYDFWNKCIKLCDQSDNKYKT